MFKKTISLFSALTISLLTTFPAFGATLSSNEVEIALIENNFESNEIVNKLKVIIDKPKEEKISVDGEIVEVSSPETAEPIPTYKATFTMESTAYTDDTITATGIETCRDENGLSTVAVDPRIIPLGSLLEIVGYGYALAADTGGAIIGNIVDVFFNSYDECMTWGRRDVTVNLIAYPGEW